MYLLSSSHLCICRINIIGYCIGIGQHKQIIIGPEIPYRCISSNKLKFQSIHQNKFLNQIEQTDGPCSCTIMLGVVYVYIYLTSSSLYAGHS